MINPDMYLTEQKRLFHPDFQLSNNDLKFYQIPGYIENNILKTTYKHLHVE